MIEEKCSNCKYWFCHIADNKKMGICRRYPPAATMVIEPKQSLEHAGLIGVPQSYTVWPETGEDVRCGEYHPRIALMS